MRTLIINKIRESIQVKEAILADEALLAVIEQVVDQMIGALVNDNTIFLAGNGGSSSDAQHIAAELVGRFYKERKGLAAEALTANTAILTALGNDYGYDSIFARQIEARAKKGDVFIGLSTSGNSQNILNAIAECKNIGVTTVGMTGLTGGKMANDCDMCIKIPSKDTPRIQESHITIGHIICELVENAFSQS